MNAVSKFWVTLKSTLCAYEQRSVYGSSGISGIFLLATQGTRSSASRFSCVVMRPPHDSSTRTRRRFLSGHCYRSLGNKSQIEEAAEVVCMRLEIIWHSQDIRTTFVVTSKPHCRGRMPSVIFRSQLLPTT